MGEILFAVKISILINISTINIFINTFSFLKYLRYFRVIDNKSFNSFSNGSCPFKALNVILL